MSRYHVRVESPGIAREVGYNTLAEVQAVLKELDSREYKRDEGSKRLLTGTMIREAAQRYFNKHPADTFAINHFTVSEKDMERQVAMSLFLSDLADMLNAELSK